MNINHLTKQQQERLLQSLNRYYDNTGQDDHISTFNDLLQRFPDGILNLAYTTYGDNEQFDIQVNFNMNKMRYEEWINLELYFNPSESYDRTFDDFCDEIESCDFDSMIHNCVQECADREVNPERMFDALKKNLLDTYEKQDAEKEYRKVLWYLLHEDGSSIYDLIDFSNNYKKNIIDDYFKDHDYPSEKVWTEYLTMLNDKILGKNYTDILSKGKNFKENQKDNVKSK